MSLSIRLTAAADPSFEIVLENWQGWEKVFTEEPDIERRATLLSAFYGSGETKANNASRVRQIAEALKSFDVSALRAKRDGQPLDDRVNQLLSQLGLRRDQIPPENLTALAAGFEVTDKHPAIDDFAPLERLRNFYLEAAAKGCGVICGLC